MQYHAKNNEVISITETSGVIQNVSSNYIEISNSPSFVDSFILRQWEKINFQEKLYVRACDSNAPSIKFNVAPFVSSGGVSKKDIAAILGTYGDWEISGTTATRGYLYKNTATSAVTLQGVKSIENFVTEDNSTTIPAEAFDSDSQITLSSKGGEFYFGEQINLLVESQNTSLKGTSNDTIILGEEASNCTICSGSLDSVYGNGKGNIFQASSTTYIWGFTENDTVQSLNEITGLSGWYDAAVEGNSFYITTKNGSIYLKGYGGGRRLNVLNPQGQIASVGSPEKDFYTTPKILYNSSDIDEIINEKDGWTIDAGAGADYIENRGASNVSIYGGTANDSIVLTAATLEGEKIYGQNVSIDGGLGNEVIIFESVESNGLSVVDPNAPPHIVCSRKTDGNDTIYFWGDKDSLVLDKGSAVVSVSVQGEDFYLLIGEEGSTRYNSRVMLVDYLKDMDWTIYDKGVNTVQGLFSGKVLVPRLLRGSTGSDTAASGVQASLNNIYDHFTIDALAGNDRINNSGNYCTILGGAGNDSITNSGKFTYIYGGAGNEKITLSDGAADNTIEVEGGNDSIWGNGGGHTFIFGTGNGVNYIFGFNPEKDKIKIAQGSEQSLNTGMTFGTNHTISAGNTVIYLKGNLKSGGVDSVAADFVSLEAGSKVSIETSTFTTENEEIIYDEKTKTEIWTIPRSILASNSNDTISNLKSEGRKADNYTLNAAAGNDLIVNEGSNCLILCGLGNDIISLVGDAANCTVEGNYGNDAIYSNGKNHVFSFSATHGADTIFGFTENDTIFVQDSGSTIADSGGVISLKGSNGTTYLRIQDYSGDSIKIILGEGNAPIVYKLGG